MRPVAVLLLGVLAGLAPARVHGQEKPRHEVSQAALGASLFKTYCATCHGVTGRGDGPMADQLRFRPSDLTLVARRNGGKFPFDKVQQVMDGRSPVKGHGGPDMPVWGDAFRNAWEGYDEKQVAEKIRRLSDYIASIQEPAGGQ
jgi:mono/diheme cytochrome c family protein